MLVYETKVYLNQFGVKPGSTKWRILQLIRCSFKCLHLGEMKRLFFQNIPQMLQTKHTYTRLSIRFSLEQSTKVENG